MKRVFEIKDERILIQAVSENIAGLGKPAVRLLLKAGEIRVNGQKRTTDCLLAAGDTVSVFLPQKYENVQIPKIIFADENILIADKPPRYDVENNLLDFIKKIYPNAMAVHRLDRGTSGLVVFALNQSALAALSAAFKQRALSKTYYAWVSGRMTKQGVFLAYLLKNAEKGEVRIFDVPTMGGKKIQTQIEILRATKDKSLLKIGLITGRTHQIRAHLAHLGHPVLGDGRYGTNEKNAKSEKSISLGGEYALCAAEIKFVKLQSPLEYLNKKIFTSGYADKYLTENY